MIAPAGQVMTAIGIVLGSTALLDFAALAGFAMKTSENAG
jgi:hypothetical protein